jgi:hypothetical protein
MWEHGGLHIHGIDRFETFRAGEEIKGEVYMTTKAPIALYSIVVRLEGKDASKNV